MFVSPSGFTALTLCCIVLQPPDVLLLICWFIAAFLNIDQPDEDFGLTILLYIMHTLHPVINCDIFICAAVLCGHRSFFSSLLLLDSACISTCNTRKAVIVSHVFHFPVAALCYCIIWFMSSLFAASPSAQHAVVGQPGGISNRRNTLFVLSAGYSHQPSFRAVRQTSTRLLKSKKRFQDLQSAVKGEQCDGQRDGFISCKSQVDVGD